MKIIIGADIVATGCNIQYFKSGDIKAIIGSELMDILNLADYRIFNIEAPITNNWTPIKKAGSPQANFHMDEAVMIGIKALNPSFLTLANNHILDQGIQGLSNTVKLIDKAHIAYGGVGANLSEACKVFYTDIEGRKLGIYCCAEHEFSIATNHSAGANPFDPLESLEHIEKAKKNCDFLIILYHGGREFYRYPSPEVQHRFRKMAEKGADLIVAQHTHCIGCYEKYMGATLVYGQGNFIFDYKDDEYWNTGVLIETDLSDVNFIPYIKREGRIDIARGKMKDKILDDLYDRSKNVVNVDFVEKEYERYADSLFENLLRTLHGNSLLFKLINKVLKIVTRGKSKFVYRFYNENSLLAVLNFVECEAHREAIIKAIRNRILK